MARRNEPESVVDAAVRFRIAVLRHDARTLDALTQRYREAARRLSKRHAALQARIRAARADGQPISPAWLFQEQRYHELIQALYLEMAKFGAFADGLIIDSAEQAARLGGSSARTLAGIVGGFASLDRDAALRIVAHVEQTIGGTLLRYLPDMARREAESVLIDGVIQRWNPDKTGRALRRVLGGPLWRAQTIARTETLRAYRSAHLDAWRQTSVIGGWVWLSGADARTCAVCWAMHGTEHDMDEPMATHPNCFPAGTLVDGPRAVASTARWYDGEMVEVRLASGRLLACTPNHPVLTLEGWVAAGLLHEGGHVVGRALGEWPRSSVDPDHHDVPALIEQVAEALGGDGAMVAGGVPTAAEDFHGDGLGSEVHVVRAARLLGSGDDAALGEPGGQQHLCGRHAALASFASDRAADEHVQRVLLAAAGGLGGAGVGATLLDRPARGHQAIGLDASAGLDAGGEKAPADRAAADSEAFRQSLLRFAGQVAPDQIVGVRRYGFSGHVYNLQTADGWYIANGVVTHNCRCTPIPVTGTERVRESFGLSGPERFARLSPRNQLRVLGRGKWEAYRAGRLRLEDVVERVEHPVWGPTLRERPLRDLEGALV